MMTWVLRTARAALLLALVFALVASANYLLASNRSAPNAASQPSIAVAEVGDASPTSDSSQSADASAVADQPTADQPTDLSPNLTDSDADAAQPAPPSADSAPNADSQPADSAEVVQLVAPNAPASSGQAADATAQGQFKRTELAKLSYGAGAANVGLSTGANRRPVGPASFAVDSQGTFYLSDNVNGRIQVFSTQGNHLRSLKADTDVYDLATGSATGSALGSASELYLLGSDGSLVVQDAQTGKAKAKGATASVAAGELGTLRVSSGQLMLESPQQVAYPLAVSRPEGLSLLSSAEQTKGQSKGAATLSQRHYTTSYRDGGHIYRIDSSGKQVEDIGLKLSDVQTVVFLQEDKAGNVYVQVERASGSGQVSVEVREYGKKGELLAVVPIDRVDYVPMTRSVTVTEDGTIYQVVPSAQGVTLVKYARS